MGCSSSCNIFETFSTALEWIAKDTFQASSVIHILDDFLFIGPSKAKFQIELDNFLYVCRRISVPIADYWPNQCFAIRRDHLRYDIDGGSSSRGQAYQMPYPVP